MEVTVIDNRDLTGRLASASRIGEIYMTSVQTMVDNVIAEIGARNISRLNILDHGGRNFMQIGSDLINMQTLSQFTNNIQRLNGHFTKSGFVHFQHCNVGQNRPLLIALADIFGVTVYAGTGTHNANYRVNYGDYVRCDPDGACQADVRRPGTAPPPDWYDDIGSAAWGGA